MHYIRLLRPPIVDGAQRRSLHLVLTITTDLGDSFLCPDQPIRLSVAACSRGGDAVSLSTPQRPAVWRAGMRILKLDLFLPPTLGADSLVRICPADEQLVASSADDIVRGSRGLVFPVYVNLPAAGAETTHVSLRRLALPSVISEDESPPIRIEVQEDIGESIARHVWDAGIATVSVLASLRPRDPASSVATSLPWLADTFSRRDGLRVLELGSGVGILGIGIASLLRSSPERGGAAGRVLLTDLAEAEERARANMARYEASSRPGSSKLHVAYENLDWDEARHGRFGPLARSQPWDLVVLSDCTYNVDMLPALVETLSALHATRQSTSPPGGPAESKVLLATKPRHPSERALFGLMASDGWTTRESTVLPLPVLGAEAQSVEIYLFSKGVHL